MGLQKSLVLYMENKRHIIVQPDWQLKGQTDTEMIDIWSLVKEIGNLASKFVSQIFIAQLHHCGSIMIVGHLRFSGLEKTKIKIKGYLGDCDVVKF